MLSNGWLVELVEYHTNNEPLLTLIMNMNSNVYYEMMDGSLSSWSIYHKNREPILSLLMNTYSNVCYEMMDGSLRSWSVTRMVNRY